MNSTVHVGAAIAALALALSAQRPGLTPADVMRIVDVGGAVASPDGNAVAFVRREPRASGDAPGPARSFLHVVGADGDGERRALDEPLSSSSIAWTPDGARLCVVRKGDGDEHAEVWGIPVGGGAPEKITATPHGVGAFAWRPDGGAIAYTVEDPAPGARAAAREMGYRQRVVDEDFDHVSLWLYDCEGGDNRKLTSGVTVFSFAWAPSGTYLAAAIAPRNLVDDSYVFQRLHLVIPAEGRVEELVDNPGKLGEFAWSPGGETLAYVSAVDRRDPHAGQLFTVRRGTREPTLLTPGFRGMVHDIEWLDGDDRYLLAAIDEGVQSSLVRVDIVNGGLTPVAQRPGHSIAGLTRGGGRSFVAVHTAGSPGDLYRVEDSGFARLTDSNPWLSGVELGEQRVVRFPSVGGVEIEGLLILPVGHRDGDRHPLVIVVHGGPESHYTDGWLTGYSAPGQVLAARGFAAWYPNYRASTGYGVAFAKADHGDPMGDEFRDHLAAIDHLVATGIADGDRVGIIGGSYGGYTAAWAATAGTARFAAAVSFVPFVDIRTKWLTSDIPWEFYFVHYQERWPHEQPGLLADRSPLTWAPSCDTPLLLLGGTADPRVHPSQPFMLYRAVKTATDTPCRYVQYPGEGHGNRSDVYRYDYLLRSLRWLEHYLRPGDHRDDPPPPVDLDYGAWAVERAGRR